MATKMIPYRNVSPNGGPLVWSNPPGGGGTIEWGEVGAKDGSDVQEISEDQASTVWIRKACTKGHLAEDTPDGVEEAMILSVQAQEDKKGKIDSVMAKVMTPDQQAIVISEDEINGFIDGQTKQKDNEARQAVQDRVSAPFKAGNPPDEMDAINSI